VAVSDVQDVAGGDTQDVAESPVEPDLAALLASDDGINRVLEDERFKTLRGRLDKEAKDAELRGRQAYEKELRQRQASDEVLAAAARTLALEMGVDAEEEKVKQYATTFTRPFIERNQVELSKVYIEGAKASLSPDAQAAIDLAVGQAGEDVEALNSIVGQLWQYHGQASREDAVSNLSLEQVPEGSKLWKDLEAWKTREVETELKAREAEANKVDPGPRASTGSAISTSRTEEIDQTLRTAKPSSVEYQQAYSEKYGFKVPVR
jgi:hypothetical protein